MSTPYQISKELTSNNHIPMYSAATESQSMNKQSKTMYDIAGIRRRIKTSILFPLCLACLSAFCTTTEVPAEGDNFDVEELEPNSTHSRISTIVVDQVRNHHLLRQKVLDDIASAEIYERYLDMLDDRKRFLLQSDVDEFEKYRLELDNALATGNLEPAFKMFNRLQRRTIERLRWLLERLDTGIDSFDLHSEETLDIDNENRPYPKDIHEADRLWEKLLTSNIISAKLDGDDDLEILERFEKRYRTQLRQINQIKSEEVFTSYLNSFTKSFDPHTEYFSPRGKEEFELQMSLSMEGIGARLELIDDYVNIKELIQGGPAEREGNLKANDRIVAVGQSPTSPLIDVVGWRLDDVVDLIRGPKGTVVVLAVKSPDSLGQDSKTVQITRDEIRINELAARKELIELEHAGRNYKIGVIELPSMYRDFNAAQRGTQDFSSATRDVQRLIDELKLENIDGLLVDLRGNGGGSLDEAVSLVGLFIESGPTVQVRGIGRRVSVLHDRDMSVAWDGPLGVLVDHFSASASEIFAGAIQDYGRGIVIGNQTFGKGTVQSLVPANPGQLKVTQAKFYRINGSSTQLKGVIPDIELETVARARETGERTYDGALPWDEITSLSYQSYNEEDHQFDVVRDLHDKRKETSPYFQFIRKIAEQTKKEEERKKISLNLKVREAELQERNELRVSITNPFLIANDLEPATSIAELDDRMDNLGDQMSKEVDLESSRILLDYALPGIRHLAAVTEQEMPERDAEDLQSVQGAALNPQTLEQ